MLALDSPSPTQRLRFLIQRLSSPWAKIKQFAAFSNTSRSERINSSRLPTLRRVSCESRTGTVLDWSLPQRASACCSTPDRPPPTTMPGHRPGRRRNPTPAAGPVIRGRRIPAAPPRRAARRRGVAVNRRPVAAVLPLRAQEVATPRAAKHPATVEYPATVKHPATMRYPRTAPPRAVPMAVRRSAMTNPVAEPPQPSRPKQSRPKPGRPKPRRRPKPPRSTRHLPPLNPPPATRQLPVAAR